jgi:prefoldin subunit 5
MRRKREVTIRLERLQEVESELKTVRDLIAGLQATIATLTKEMSELKKSLGG